MKVISTIKEMQEVVLKQNGLAKSIGFVPTMGFLHEGHLTLIKKAKQENDLVVLSIFVNPLQFGPGEDFETYPRDFDRDRALAESEKADFLFYPSPKEMYPAQSSVKLTVHDRTDVLCGKSRPGHFDGVVTVISKLFHIIQPTRAYFGKKDAQQLAVIEALTKDFNFPVQIVPVDIVREEDGLAKSSRNVNLSFEDRNQAPILYKSLMEAKAAIEAGEKSPKNIIELVRNILYTAERSTIDYVEVLSYPELKPIENLTGSFIIALAVKFAQVRLIDNLIYELKWED
jgi:pantoate--beta-alanine ligase